MSNRLAHASRSLPPNPKKFPSRPPYLPYHLCPLGLISRIHLILCTEHGTVLPKQKTHHLQALAPQALPGSWSPHILPSTIDPSSIRPKHPQSPTHLLRVNKRPSSHHRHPSASRSPSCLFLFITCAENLGLHNGALLCVVCADTCAAIQLFRVEQQSGIRFPSVNTAELSSTTFTIHPPINIPQKNNIHTVSQLPPSPCLFTTRPASRPGPSIRTPSSGAASTCVELPWSPGQCPKQQHHRHNEIFMSLLLSLPLF